MFRNQRGTFYGNEMWWIMLTIILAVIIIPPIAQISQYGLVEGWARYTAPPPLQIIDWQTAFLAQGLNMLMFMGYMIGGCIVLMALFFIGYLTLNYFWFERKEPNLNCRIFGHQYIDRSPDQADDIIMEDGERFHRNIDLWCPTCGKEHGKHSISSTYNKKTGEVREYGKRV